MYVAAASFGQTRFAIRPMVVCDRRAFGGINYTVGRFVLSLI